jgi:activator of HSP90 ATPase
MATHVTQKLTFKKTKPKALFNLYMNPKQHGHISGSPVKISSKIGAEFSSHGGYITGKTIYTAKDKIIVQNWRAKDWAPEAPDSVFTIILEPKGKDTVLHAIHSNIPEGKEDSIAKGWHEHYWGPWKQFLAGKKIKRPSM